MKKVTDGFAQVSLNLLIILEALVIDASGEFQMTEGFEQIAEFF